MKLAIPIHNGNVSSVFDFAHKLLLVNIEDEKETNRSEIEFKSQSLPQRAGQLKNLGVEVLVCGAISRDLANMVEAFEIKLLPYVTGSIDEVLQACLTGQWVQPRFTMPGCWYGNRRGFGRKQRGCQWRGRKN